MRRREGAVDVDAGYEVLERFMDQLSRIGARDDGSFERLAWTAQDAAARAVFTDTATRLGLRVEVDAATNLWAWLGDPGPGAVITGSHLDTVRGGGNYDGTLGVAAGLAALQRLAAAPTGLRRPVAVVVFSDEEGARFDTPCFGSRLLTGAVDMARLAERRDEDGVTLAQAVAAAGFAPAGLRAEPARVAGLHAFVELHIEQGHQLADRGPHALLGVGTAIWPHGRWRIALTGEANHAGTTAIADRRDPLWALAATIMESRRHAEAAGGVATIGRVVVDPNSTNSIARRATAWLDLRARDEGALRAMRDRIEEATRASAARTGIDVAVAEESFSAAVTFSPSLNERVRGTLRAAATDVALLDTAAGHDAGILAAHVPTTMLFVRNDTGASHTAGEYATPQACRAGYEALMRVLRDLAS